MRTQPGQPAECRESVAETVILKCLSPKHECWTHVLSLPASRLGSALLIVLRDSQLATLDGSHASGGGDMLPLANKCACPFM